MYTLILAVTKLVPGIINSRYGRACAELGTKFRYYYLIKNPNTGESIWPKETAVWKYGSDMTAKLVAENRLYWGADGCASFPRVKLFLSEMGGVVPRSIWLANEVGHTQEATGELKALFDGAQVFDSPKPIRLINRLLQLGCSEPGDIVLDFFAGSGTTAHAVMKRNAETGSDLKVMLVQLPEPIESGDYRTIADITKARLRRAAKQISAQIPGYGGDLG
jgi:adenine-specific DNA-methyltransferase